MASKSKQNLTVRLDRSVIRRAKVLAAKRGTSISRIVEETIERTVAESEAFDAARRRALQHLDKGFHFGGVIRATRNELHVR